MEEKELFEKIDFIPSVEVAIDLIKLDPNNSNEMSDEQMAGLEAFMKKHGFAVEVWINDQGDGTYLVIDGEHRIIILQKYGIKTVMAKIFKVPYSEVRMMRQLANKIGGIDNKDKYSNELRAIHQDGNLAEFAAFLARPRQEFEILLNRKFNIPIGTPEETDKLEPPRETNIKRGEIFKLGNHYVMCGDCTNKEDVAKLMQPLVQANKKINQVTTDPPYGVDYGNKNAYLNSQDGGNRLETEIIDDNILDYRQFFRSFLELIPLEPYNTVYIFSAGKELHSLRLATEDVGIFWSDYLIWEKNNHVIGRKDYAAKHEFVFYGWKGKHKFNGPFSTTILHFDKPLSNKLHPTQKPVELFQRLITDGSQEGDIVYDAFLGSGSSLIAAQQCGRILYGMEKDPFYVETTIQRWEEYTKLPRVQIA